MSVAEPETTWRDAGRPYAMVTVEFTPAGATAASEIMVQYKQAVDGTEEAVAECDGTQDHCEVFTPASGGVVQISDTPFRDKQHGDGSNLISSLYVDGMVVTLWAQVPLAADGTVVSATPVLSREQVVALLSQPEWGHLVPVD